MPFKNQYVDNAMSIGGEVPPPPHSKGWLGGSGTTSPACGIDVHIEGTWQGGRCWFGWWAGRCCGRLGQDGVQCDGCHFGSSWPQRHSVALLLPPSTGALPTLLAGGRPAGIGVSDRPVGGLSADARRRRRSGNGLAWHPRVRCGRAPCIGGVLVGLPPPAS